MHNDFYGSGVSIPAIDASINLPGIGGGISIGIGGGNGGGVGQFPALSQQQRPQNNLLMLVGVGLIAYLLFK